MGRTDSNLVSFCLHRLNFVNIFQIRHGRYFFIWTQKRISVPPNMKSIETGSAILYFTLQLHSLDFRSVGIRLRQIQMPKKLTESSTENRKLKKVLRVYNFFRHLFNFDVPSHFHSGGYMHECFFPITRLFGLQQNFRNVIQWKCFIWSEFEIFIRW